MVVMVAITAVGTAFRLERDLQLYKLGSEAMEHVLDHMIPTNAKNPIENFSRQVPISQMPRKAHELIGITVPYLDNRLRSGLHHEQSPIFKLQGVPVSHCNRFRQIQKHVLALIRNKPDAAAMARVEIERESARRMFRWPMPDGPMN
jgi:hypothetical protein